MKKQLFIILIAAYAASTYAMLVTLQDGTKVSKDVAEKTFNTLKELVDRTDDPAKIALYDLLAKAQDPLRDPYCWASIRELVRLDLLSKETGIIPSDTVSVVRNALFSEGEDLETMTFSLVYPIRAEGTLQNSKYD